MSPTFKIKTISKTKIIKNASISFIFIFSFILIFFSKSDYFIANKLKVFSNNYLLPIANVVTAPMDVVSEIILQFNEFKSLESKNKILKEEIMRLKKWQILAIQNSEENRVFKKLLNATDNNLELVKTASVTQRNDFLYSRMININAGVNDGVIKKMPVVNHRGLVGKIINSSENNSNVLLITDQNSSISIKTVADDIFSILTGAEDGVHLESAFVKDEKMPKIGDLVITSGTAKVLPKGILVGKIVKIKNNKFYILPFVDFDNIDYVQIVKSK